MMSLMDAVGASPSGDRAVPGAGVRVAKREVARAAGDAQGEEELASTWPEVLMSLLAGEQAVLCGYPAEDAGVVAGDGAGAPAVDAGMVMGDCAGAPAVVWPGGCGTSACGTGAVATVGASRGEASPHRAIGVEDPETFGVIAAPERGSNTASPAGPEVEGPAAGGGVESPVAVMTGPAEAMNAQAQSRGPGAAPEAWTARDRADGRVSARAGRTQLQATTPIRVEGNEPARASVAHVMAHEAGIPARGQDDPAVSVIGPTGDAANEESGGVAAPVGNEGERQFAGRPLASGTGMVRENEGGPSEGADEVVRRTPEKRQDDEATVTGEPSRLDGDARVDPGIARPAATGNAGAEAIADGVEGRARRSEAQEARIGEIGRQIVDQARVLKFPDRTEVEIRLKPESLGKVIMRISMEGDRLSAQFEVSEPEVRSVLETRMDELRRGLAERGLDVRDLSVSVGDGAGAGRYGRDAHGGGRSQGPSGHLWIGPARGGGLEAVSARWRNLDRRALDLMA